MVSEVGVWLGLVPVLWCALCRWPLKRPPSRDAWIIAAALLVSFGADVSAYRLSEEAYTVVANWYPLSQATAVAFVLLDREKVAGYFNVLLVTALLAVLWQGPAGQDLLFRTVAWGSITALALQAWELGGLRSVLLLTFGWGLLCWYAWAWNADRTVPLSLPNVLPYLAYLGTRVLGTAVFCVTVARPKQTPKLLHVTA